ncbi:MAG TPA: hypothetical protein VEU47_02365 [Candidatus Cybelea sp.]|nr:hypothetical protein [Candidatus Cybelea sp.]
MYANLAYADWHLPLSREAVTLREAAEALAQVGAAPSDIPFVVRLAENPKFDLFHGAADLKTHDYIHIVLGRGLLAKDEAFVIGFTMGSTHQLNLFEQALFGKVARHLYPGVYRFSAEDEKVFHDAARLGYISDCAALNDVDYASKLDSTVGDIRRELRVDPDLLRAYFRIEARRFPQSKESQRLLD